MSTNAMRLIKFTPKAKPSQTRKPEPAEVGLQWLMTEKPGAYYVVANLIFDLIKDPNSRVFDEQLQARLRREHARLYPDSRWKGGA